MGYGIVDMKGWELILQWFEDQNLQHSGHQTGLSSRTPEDWCYLIKFRGYTIRIWNTEVYMIGSRKGHNLDMKNPNFFNQLAYHLNILAYKK
jgi:hypothetical protein